MSTSLDLISFHYIQSTVKISLICRFHDEQSLFKELILLIRHSFWSRPHQLHFHVDCSCDEDRPAVTSKSTNHISRKQVAKVLHECTNSTMSHGATTQLSTSVMNNNKVHF